MRIKHQITNYAPLFNSEDFARMQYNKNTAFRRFVEEWNADLPELLGWTLTDFYLAFQTGCAQLTLGL